VRARGLGADDEQARAEEEAGATASGHGVDVELRRLDGDARGHRLVDLLVDARIARHICRRTTLFPPPLVSHVHKCSDIGDDRKKKKKTMMRAGTMSKPIAGIFSSVSVVMA
jgi:hypothetical protein